MNEQKVLEKIQEGYDALELLEEADPKLSTRFRKIDKQIDRLLKDVKKHFPDAIFYTAGGDGFALLLGSPHDANQNAQQKLIACIGISTIDGGDF